MKSNQHHSNNEPHSSYPKKNLRYTLNTHPIVRPSGVWKYQLWAFPLFRTCENSIRKRKEKSVCKTNTGRSNFIRTPFVAEFRIRRVTFPCFEENVPRIGCIFRKWMELGLFQRSTIFRRSGRISFFLFFPLREGFRCSRRWCEFMTRRHVCLFSTFGEYVSVNFLFVWIFIVWVFTRLRFE